MSRGKPPLLIADDEHGPRRGHGPQRGERRRAWAAAGAPANDARRAGGVGRTATEPAADGDGCRRTAPGLSATQHLLPQALPRWCGSRTTKQVRSAPLTASKEIE